MAQNQQIKMSLMFDVDTSRAKASLKDLQNSLNGLTKNIESGDFPMTGKIQEAYVAAEKLKRILNASVNMSTGQFDLSKFNAQLKQGGLSAQELGQKFAGAGAAGAQAFAQLATTIANAEIPTKRMSHLVENMARSLKQTMQWQISSSIVHGFTGALQSAYGYAKDLNRSLNDIRIVTGENIEFMERYATQANRAAKALSTTTNEYAKASLIFYQQGLDDDAVSRRTAAAVKMANVTGESAQDISSYMTAIWNNFDNGTKSLEYYADAITALGAATASSTEEIAGGMQQFASVAETVGLSYEYAASALATVVSATRQSEETVGTSFKTIFARLSSLQLGETLEDGVTLTKYSEALRTVGVNIMDANGQLKSMDQILDELGNKWRNISREQQNALAYTVAGTRQYNNFISLLDNYETFKVNVDLAIDSEGTLEEQQKIYAESWQAAARKAKAAAESIYEKLLDDDFFVTMLNGLEKFLSGLDKFIDAIGGLPGVLSLVSTLMLRIFSAQAAESVRNMAYGFKSLTGVAQVEAGVTKAEFLKAARSSINSARSDVDVDLALNTELDALQKRTELEQIYLQYEDKLSQKQKDDFNLQLQLLDILRQQNKEKAKAVEQTEQQVNRSGYQIMATATNVSGFRENKEKAWKQKHGEALASKAGEKTRIDQNLEQIRALEAQVQNDITNLENGEYQKALAQRTALTSKVTALSNTEGVKKQDLDNAKAERDIADGIVKIIEQELDENRQLLDEIQAERINLEQQQTQLKTTVEQLTNEKFTGADNYQDASNAGSLLQKYTTYTAGQDTIIQDSFENLFKPFGEGVSAGEGFDVESKQELVSELEQFADNYAVKLGEETAKRLTAIIGELKASENVDTETLNKFKSEYQKANEQDRNKYKKSGAQEIRTALEEEHGILVKDEPFAEYSAGLQQLTHDVKNYTATNHNSQKVQEGVAEGLRDKAENALPDAAQSFVNLSTGITSTVSAFMSMKGAIDILNSTEMSFGDKMFAIFSSMGTIVGSVISAITAFQKVNLKAMADEAKSTIITWANVLADKASAKAKREKAAAADESADATGRANKATIKETATNMFSNLKGGLKNTGTKIATNAKEFGSGFINTSKALVGKGAPAVEGVTTGAGSLASSLGTIMAVAGPILIAVGAIIGAVAIGVSIYQAAEKEAKKAEAQAKSTRDAANEVKEAYQSTIDTISNYSKAKDSLSSLTKGTQEWKQALIETNDKARELIDKFGEDLSANDYYIDADGQIQFKDGVLEDLQAKEYANMMSVQASADAAQINAIQKREEANKVAFARKEMRTGLTADADTWGTMGAAVGGGALAGAALGTLIPVIGNVAGAIIGGAIGAIGGIVATSVAGVSSDKEVEAIDKLAAAYRKDDAVLDKLAQAQERGGAEWKDMLETLGLSEKMANALLDNKDATYALIKEVAANTNQQQLLRESMVSSANAGKEAYESSENKDYINAYASAMMTDEESQKYKDIEAQVKQDFKGSNDDFWDKYLETMYGDDAKNYRIKNQGGGNVTLQKKDEDGKWVTDEALGKNGLSEEDAIEAYIEKKMSELTDDEIRALDKQAQDLKAQLAAAGIQGSEQIHSAGLNLLHETSVDLNNLSREAIENLNFDVIDNEEYRNSLIEAQEDTEAAWNQASEIYSLYTSEQAQISRKNTVNSLSYISKALSEIAVKGGKDTATQFGSEINKLIEQYPDRVNEISSIIGEIDWDQGGAQALAAIRSKLQDIGIEIDITNEDWQSMSNLIKQIQMDIAAFDLSKFRADISEINKIIRDLAFGEVISDDEFNKLSQYSDAVRDLFIQTAEGYEFIGEEGLLDNVAAEVLRTQAREQMVKLGQAENAKATNNLNQGKANSIWADMVEVASSDSYADFRAAYGYDSQQLKDLAEKGKTAESELNDLSEIEKSQGYLTEKQKRKRETWEAIYNEAKGLADQMYADSIALTGLDTEVEKRAIAEVTASTYSSIQELQSAERKFANDPVLKTAYDKRLDQLKKLEKQYLKSIDHYQNEETALKRLTREQEALNEAKGSATGTDYLNILEQEIELSKEQEQINQKNLDTANADRTRAKINMSKALRGMNAKFSIKTDDNGNITNWEELDAAAKSGTDKQKEEYKKFKAEIQAAEDKVYEYGEAIKDNQKDQRTLWLESATYIAKFNDEIRELELDWLDYQLSHLEDVAFSTAETLALVGSQLNAYQGTAIDAKNELNNIAEKFKVAPRQEDESIGDFMARIIAEAPKARKEVMTVGATLKTTLENYEAADQALADSLLKHFEDIADYYDNISEKFDNMSNTVKHYRNVVDLVGKEILGITDETLTEMNKTEQALANAGVKNSRAKYDKIAEDRAKAEAGLAEAIANGDEAAQARWKNTLKEIDSMEQEALQKMNDSWAAALEVAAQILEDNTQRIMDSFAKSMAGIYGSFDRMSEVFGQQSELNAQYVADYKKIYELSKLTRNIQNQIDNTDSVSAKQTLKDLQQEITELQASGTKLSQYDLDYLQKKYDLRVAEIALEEAQNAKSQVRLQRMADGSWGYVYTQNAEAVENAQQNYEDKLYALQELSSGYLDETSEQIISVQAKFQEAINTIMSSGLSDEEKRKQIEETVKFYQDRLSFLTGEFDKVISNNQGMANMVQSFSETLLGALYPTEMYNFDSATDIFDLFTEKLGDWESGSGVLGELKTTLADYNTSVSAIFTYAGSSIEGFGNELVNTVVGDGTDENPGILNEIVDYLETTEVENPELPAIDSFIDLLSQKKDEIHGLIEGIKTDYGSFMDMMSDSRILTDSGLKRGEAISYVEESGYEPKDGWQSISDEQLLEIFQAVVMRMEPPQYDTGGYTGEWGSSGKLAMVHEKEIILNPEDTLNLLKTIEIMDRIIKAIDMESAAAASAKALTVSTVSSSSDTLQQEVTIHAEFPNATNRSEIEEAFDTLINRAAQYTNRNR